MTLNDLSRLWYLNREIELDEERLAELEDMAVSITSPLSDMPSGKGGINRSLEEVAVKIANIKEIINRKKERCIHEREVLEDYISTVPDSLVRMVLILRFINGLPWAQVASSIGGKCTEDSVKKICYRWIREEEQRERERINAMP